MGRNGGWRLLHVFRDRLWEFSRLNLVTNERVTPEPNVRVFNDFVPGDLRLTVLLRETSVFALPSDTDMSPYSVLEAMALGIPVVACRIGALPEMVEDGVTGLLVEAGDDEGLGDALATLLHDAELRQQMGEAGRARFLRYFDVAVTTGALVEVLKQAATIFAAADS
jgi:glycosyltransferase involved in cell wall biosynthesis